MSQTKHNTTRWFTTRRFAVSWLRNLSIRWRTFLLVSVGIVVILAAVGFLSLQALQESTERILADRLRLARLAAQQVDHEVADILAVLRRAAATEGFDLTDADPEPERNVLRELYRTGLFSYDVFITDEKGVVRLVEPDGSDGSTTVAETVGADLSAYAHIRAALQTSQPQVSNLIFHVTTPRPLLSFVIPVNDKTGAVAGLIGGETDPTRLSFADMLRQLEVPSLGHVCVSDSDGLVLASTNPDWLFKQRDHAGRLVGLIADRQSVVSRCHACHAAEAGPTRQTEIMAFVPLALAPWGVSIAEPEAVVLAPVYNLRRRLIAIGAAILLTGGVLTWLTTQAVVGPIQRLLAATRRIASGDLATPVAITGGDEVTALARSFEAMRQKLAAWGQELETAVQQRTHELSVVYAIDRIAAQSLDLDEILNKSLDKVLEVLDVEAGGIYLLEPGGETMMLRVQRGLSDEFVENVQRIRLGEGIAGRAAAERKPVVLDVSDYPTERLASFVVREGFQTLASTPLLSAAKLMGALNLAARRPRAFPPEELDLMEAIGRQLGGAVHNVHLFEETGKHAARLADMLQLSTDLTTLQDESALLNLLVTRAAALAESATCTVMRVDETTNEAVLAAQIGLPAGTPLGLRVSLSLPILRRAVESGEPIIVPNIDRDAPELRAVLLHPGIHAFFAYPMVREGRTLGFITLSRLTPYAPSREEIMTYRLLAERAAAALENARLCEETQQRLAELSALFEVSRAMRHTQTLDEMLPIFLHSTLQVLHCDQGILSLVDRTGGEVVTRVTSPGLESLLGMRTKIGQGIAGRVVQTGRPMLPADFAGLRPPDMIGYSLDQPRAVICYPLTVDTEVVGTIYLSTPRAHEFTEGELRLLAAISDMAASAIHRASLFEQLEQRVHELATLYDMSQAVTARLRLEDVLALVVQAAPHAVYAEGCTVFLWDERQKRLVLRAVSGVPPALVGRVRYRVGEGLIGWVFLEGRVANVPDVAADPRWKPEPEQEQTLPSGRISSVLIVPLLIGQQVLGVLGVANKSRAPAFTESDQSLLTALASQVAIAIENARLYEDVRSLSVGTIRSLATAIDARDPYTRGHSEEVTRLAVQLARTLGWSGADLEMLEFAALLHDVGKIGVPDAILRKVKRLTPDEWNILHLHPYYSAQMVKPVDQLRRIVPWIYHHHEKWDGTGYPDRLKGEAIPLAARIIAVADAFNAMTTDRPYRKARSVAEALAEIGRCAGTQFDPKIAESFLRMMTSQSS